MPAARDNSDSGPTQSKAANQMIGSFVREHVLFSGMWQERKKLVIRPAGPDVSLHSDFHCMELRSGGRKSS